MSKLSKYVIRLFFICILLSIVYFVVSPQLIQQHSEEKSLFGRNVHQQKGELGKLASPDYQITFPNDHGAHDAFDIEWWYLTANLQDESGNPYGLQWTLFRFRDPNPTNILTGAWQNNQIYMAHASIHSINTHWFSEKFARGGVGNADIEHLPFTLFIDNWRWVNSVSGLGLLPATLEFTSSNDIEPPLIASFNLMQKGPFVLHGEKGFSIKSTSRHASHYYSAPFIDIKGTITIQEDLVTPQLIKLDGEAWFDHEWTSQLFDDTTEGWDWLSLHLEDGSKIMAFRMRLSDQEDYITGTYISQTGQQVTLTDNQIQLNNTLTSNIYDKHLPLNWSLSIPSKNIDITISTIKEDQWNNALIPYYEGMVSVKGTHKGRGFLELTGY